MKNRWGVAWLMGCLLPGLLFLVACDDDNDSPDVIVVTNTVSGESVTVTNATALPEAEILLGITYAVPAGNSVFTEEVVAPDDGTIMVEVDWSGGGTMQADLYRNGTDTAAQMDEAPLSLSAQTDDGQIWTLRIANLSAVNKNVSVTIRYVPE